MKKQNFSKKRKAIYDIICSTKTHPTAEWVYNQLKGDYPDLSLGTVYRNISLFKETGKIISVGVVDGHERFDGNVAPHTHFVCKCCNNVLDIDLALEGKRLDEIVEKSSGVDVHSHSLVFFGKCLECKLKDSS